MPHAPCAHPVLHLSPGTWHLAPLLVALHAQHTQHPAHRAGVPRVLAPQLARVAPHDDREVGAARDDKVALAPRLARRSLGGREAVDAAAVATGLGDDLARARVEQQAAAPLGAAPNEYTPRLLRIDICMCIASRLSRVAQNPVRGQ